MEHWDTGAHCRCNHKFECGNLVEFDLSADCVHECNCTRIPILLCLNKQFDWLISSPFKAVLDRQRGVLDWKIEGLLQEAKKMDNKDF